MYSTTRRLHITTHQPKYFYIYIAPKKKNESTAGLGLVIFRELFVHKCTLRLCRCRYGKKKCLLCLRAASPSGCGRISASFRAAGQVSHQLSLSQMKNLITCSTCFFNFLFEFLSHSSNVNDVFFESESTEDKENNDPEDTEGLTSRLWVDRFSPRHYTELLSDDVSSILCFCVASQTQ